MATDLRCPECYATLGKDTENPADAFCGDCGTSFFNSYGYVSDQKHYDEVKKKYPKAKIPKAEIKKS